MFSVIQKIFTPDGEQIDSDSIAEFTTEAAANAMVINLATEQDDCPPNADENRCEWFVLAD